MSQIQLTMPMVEGQPILPSTAKGPDGKPRFHVPLLKELLNTDGGVRYLVSYESIYGGYEASSRQFFDAHLEPGDVFLDIGAHWGTFSLSAATRHPGQVAVIAVEPHPLNAAQLLKAVRINKLVASIEVVAAAAGAEPGMAQLRHSSTMGHSLDSATPGRADVAVLHVPVVTLDDLLRRRPDLDGKRIFMKVDVEGFEHEVLKGARGLMQSGRVAAVMWEKGESYSAESGRHKMAALLEEFEQFGFRNFRFPSSEFAGPLIPFAPTPEVGNVFALAPGFERRPVYEVPFEPRPPFNTLFATPADPATRAQSTAMLLAVHSSDGARWANPQELVAGAQERAAAAALHIPSGARVLDLGAGALALRRCLPSGCQYTPADLVARSADCRLVDLNQEQFPADEFDCIALLEVLEYLHDPQGLFAKCRQAATRMVVTYHLRGAETLNQRRERGWFNDLDSAALSDLFAANGWQIESQSPLGDATLYVLTAF